MRIINYLAVLFISASVLVADKPILPIQKLTPDDVDHAATKDKICTPEI